MTVQLTSLVLARISRLAPAGRRAGAALIGGASALAARWRAGIGAIDGVGALITGLDKIEAAGASVLRWSFRALRRGGLALTGAIAWRGLAALAGIVLAGALATALTAEDGQGRLASLIEETAATEPQPHEVRQPARPLALAEDGWIQIARPIAMFGLDSAELERQEPAYEARRSRDGTRREDLLAFGAFGESKPHLLLRVVADADVASLSQPFVVALVRAAAGRGMSVQRSGMPSAIETKFGPVDTADVTLSDPAASRACIGFRQRLGEAQLTMSGWWCGALSRPADRQQLVCLLDRLDLLSAGEDRSLHAAFARAELRRQPACSQPRLSASGRKTSWLDADGSAPALRTRSAAVERPRPARRAQ